MSILSATRPAASAGGTSASSGIQPPPAFAVITDWVNFHVKLNERMSRPELIAQQETSLCGPAAFMYCVAKHRPHAYRDYVMDLALHGRARLGNLEVVPSEECRRSAPKMMQIDPVDWVALASLRDSTNLLLPMSHAAQTAAITTPADLEAWFDACGLFNGTGNHTRLVNGGTLDDLFAANMSYSSAFVCLLLRGSIMGGGGAIGTKFGSGMPKTPLFTPDHWVVLDELIHINARIAMRNLCPSTGACSLDSERLDFRVYSWGNYHRINSTHLSLTVGEFLPYFYGYVSAGK